MSNDKGCLKDLKLEQNQVALWERHSLPILSLSDSLFTDQALINHWPNPSKHCLEHPLTRQFSYTCGNSADQEPVLSAAPTFAKLYDCMYDCLVKDLFYWK